MAPVTSSHWGWGRHNHETLLRTSGDAEAALALARGNPCRFKDDGSGPEGESGAALQIALYQAQRQRPGRDFHAHGRGCGTQRTYLPRSGKAPGTLDTTATHRGWTG
eukprot:TRINITY_DN6705_c0_g1_i2.p3 TRINITY_DN6705_c0_g1~~TRINITY_DN6705_c0_g1_i2.p3  ORF type:complete len:107 (-),score=5.27 TRINITY_DN6705_c0_g1_i2:126-446(-)